MSMSCPSDALRHLIESRNCRSKRQSSWDTTGGNNDRWEFPSGETITIADISGPGCITHIWMTSGSDEPAWTRRRVIRMYWDGEEAASVEVPLGDFFGVGHGEIRQWESAVLNMSGPDGADRSAFNCWFPMPFSKSARITVTNEGADSILYFYVDYEEYDEPMPDALRFHSQWRRENPCDGLPAHDVGSANELKNIGGEDNYVILEAEGRGHYVGCNLSIHNTRGEWWGEGDDMIFIDDDTWPPSLHGTGSEDYFSHAYGMQDVRGLYNGTSLFNQKHEKWEGKWTVYRFHILDPVVFQKRIKVTIEHGHANHRCDDYTSTAYWYQAEPHKRLPRLAPVADRLPNDL